MKSRTTFQNNLKRIIERSGLTTQQIASEIGISYNSVTNWAHGISFPSGENLFNLAAAVGATVNEIVDGIDDYRTFACGFAEDPRPGDRVCFRINGERHVVRWTGKGFLRGEIVP